MHDRENKSLDKNPFDLTKFIRSIQRLEGNPDCFKKAQGYCSQWDCVWRQSCLDDKKKGGGQLRVNPILTKPY